MITLSAILCVLFLLISSIDFLFVFLLKDNNNTDFDVANYSEWEAKL